ncbi:hypothetical protein ACJMK2_000394 [Sinanodonta woodiana]|uniref:G-protein coupled receptors family 1 profile domain-containing protein n=1 Tax=Sinanodonta woodiana TaxID=1069815 RepID=A0ABD3XSM4_SINWO
MTNQSGFDTQVIYLDREKAHVLIPAMVYVIVMMVIGTTGNISVLYFYRFRCPQTTSTFCILAIASFDVCVCIFSMPVEIADINLFYKFNSIFMCKLDRFVTHFASIASTFLLNFVAFERHRMICSPFKNKITPRQVKIACIIIVFSSIILSAPMTVFYDIIRVNVSYSGSPYEAGFECTTTKDESMEFFLLLTYVIHLAGFVATSFSLTLFYILIGYTLLKQRKFRILATRVARNLSVVGIRCRQSTRKANDGSANGTQKGYNIQHAKEKGRRSETVRKVSFQTHDIVGNDQRLSDFEESKDSDMASGLSVLDFEEIITRDISYIISESSVSEPRVTSGSCIVPMGNGHFFKNDLSLTSEIGFSAIAEITHISSTINEDNITDMTSPSDGNVRVDEAITTDPSLGGSLLNLHTVGTSRGSDSNALTTHVHSELTPSVVTSRGFDTNALTIHVHSELTPAVGTSRGFDSKALTTHVHSKVVPSVVTSRKFDSNTLNTHVHSEVAPSVVSDDLTMEKDTSATHRKSLNTRQNRTVNANSSTTKYTLIMFLVSACFLISFLPFLSLMVWRIYHNVQEVNEMSNVELILYSIGLRSYFLNSTVNPLIYGLFNTEFRSFFYGIICKWRQAK